MWFLNKKEKPEKLAEEDIFLSETFDEFEIACKVLDSLREMFQEKALFDVWRRAFEKDGKYYVYWYVKSNESLDDDMITWCHGYVAGIVRALDANPCSMSIKDYETWPLKLERVDA